MFLSAEPTPFDLHFRFLGVPVRVHPGFWLVMAILGWNPDDLQRTAIWVMAGFMSILAHELGHALTSGYFGQPSSITLHSFGGYASAFPFYGTWRNVAVVAAGPAVSFTTGGLAVLVMMLLARHPEWLPQDEGVRLNLTHLLFSLVYQGIGWGLFNILPIYPLDGGQITRYLMIRFRPWDGSRLSLQISMIVSIALGLYFFTFGMSITGLFVLSLALTNWQELQQTR